MSRTRGNLQTDLTACHASYARPAIKSSFSLLSQVSTNTSNKAKRMVLLRTNLFNSLTYQPSSCVTTHKVAVRLRHVILSLFWSRYSSGFSGSVTCFISIGLKELREVLVVNSVARGGRTPI